MRRWDEYFNRAFAVFGGLTEKGLSDKQRNSIEEFKRVGLYEPYLDIRISPKTKFRKMFINSIRYDHENFGMSMEIDDNRMPDITFDHYDIISLAYNIGYEHILIFEDDVRFLRDPSIFEEFFDNLPEYDICLFDYVKLSYDEYPIINQYYKDASYGYLFTDFYALSRRGMRYMMDNMEAQMLNSDCYICMNDNYRFNFTSSKWTEYKNKSKIDPIKIASIIPLGAQSNMNEGVYSTPGIKFDHDFRYYNI